MSVEFKTFAYTQTKNFFSSRMDLDSLQQKLNRYGQSGWSLASSTNVGTQFRPILLIVLQKKR